MKVISLPGIWKQSKLYPIKNLAISLSHACEQVHVRHVWGTE